ncbi:MAG: hypothetical protein KDC39_14965 [Actinobacteria bacterium]|mgnify:CR=1 FL=1|nr:hypothetical protein [Actinomycetota bacterium]
MTEGLQKLVYGMAIAAIVLVLIGLALDNDWLSWIPIPVFVVVGIIIGIMHPPKVPQQH